MNNREIGQYFANTFENILKKHNAYGELILHENVKNDFFKILKKENADLIKLIYSLSKSLNSEILSNFVKGFYTEKLDGNFDEVYKKMLKLKHLYSEDFKSNKNEGSLFLF